MNACWAITCASVDTLIAVEFCKFGFVFRPFLLFFFLEVNFFSSYISPNRAIEILRDLNQSSKRKSSFTEAALNKLLESNLSAKYAFKNFLGTLTCLFLSEIQLTKALSIGFQEPTDFIPDGFYDMGPMRPNGKFYAIDELIQMPMTDKRAIIIIYAPDE
jgi:hypothetical protein